MKIFRVFLRVGVCAFTYVGAPCCETWLKFESKFAGIKVTIAKEILKSGILFTVKRKCFSNFKEKFWVWVTPLVGRHVVNESKVGCYVVNEL